jgi:hypothetical protein
MKKTAILLATLGLGFSALSAQTVPEFLNYQGTVTDSAGLGLGDSPPVNRKVLFRVYDAATAGGLIWTEEQTVTISKGEFSVLLGQGIQFASEPHDSLLDVFGEGTSNRYLEITVDNGDDALNASDLPITPRQRITSTAYSFRAGTADSIASGSSLQLNTTDSGLGYFDAGRTFGGFNMSGPVLYGAGGGALGAKTGATETSALRWDGAGNVGIGTNSPLNGNKLHVVGDSYFDGKVEIGSVSQQYPVKIISAAATALTIESPAAGGYGLRHTTGPTLASFDTWVGGTQVNLESNRALNLLAAYSLSLSTNGSSRIVISSTGNVGIGTNPFVSSKLAVSGGYSSLNGLRISGSDTANTIYQATGDLGISTAQPSQSVKIGSSAAGTVLTVKNSKVGIGTSAPISTLDVVRPDNEISVISARGDAQGAGMVYVGQSDATGGGIAFDGDNSPATGFIADYTTFFRRWNGADTAVFQYAWNSNDVSFNGNVGIGTGTSSPTKAKLEVSGASGGGPQLNGFGFLGKIGIGNTTGSSTTGQLSIYASGRIIANDFIAFSDERIKDVQGRSDPSADLSTLLNIEITDYTYIDTVTNGSGAQKKVVAQQLESVYPQAVLQFTDTIPDIYANADAKDAWIQLATDLKVGERVRLISEKEDEVYEVLEVYSDKFRTEFVGEDGPVFVFGREVDDFRSVDYDAIAMLNVSATQELARKLMPQSSDLASLKAENRQLKARIAELEAKDAARDAQIAKIEQLLSAQ